MKIKFNHNVLMHIEQKDLSILFFLFQDSYNSFFLNANIQIKKACGLLSSDTKLRNGFNAIGFSQGSQFL